MAGELLLDTGALVSLLDCTTVFTTGSGGRLFVRLCRAMAMLRQPTAPHRDGSGIAAAT
jgi:hypothetical protein